MKILYDKDLNPSLRDFGIDVPIIESRYAKALEGIPKDAIYEGDWLSISQDDLLRVHNKSYIEQLFEDPYDCIEYCYELNKDRLLPEAKYSFTDLVKRAVKNTSGLYTAAKIALNGEGLAYLMGGGMHHAMSFEGRGFCLLHDIAITLKKLEADAEIKKALVIDLDAHKGCATAFNLQSDPQFFTMSIHMENGWPLDGSYLEGDACYTPSDLDVPVKPNDDYLGLLAKSLEKLPTDVDLAIVVQGADPYEADELPSTSFLKLSLEEMLQRDNLVEEFLSSRSIPRAYCMAGGYGQNTWKVYQQFLKSIAE